MADEVSPRGPVYNAYITNHHLEVRSPSPSRTSSPYRPLSQTTYTDEQLQSSRSVYPHFHRPFNDHSRYLAVAAGADRAVYRDLPRLPPPPWDGSRLDDELTTSRRPASAPPRAGGSSGSGDAVASPYAASPTLRLDLRGVTLTDNLVTSTGIPCYTISTFVEANLEEGTLAEERRGTVAVVQTYPVPPSVLGYGSGGVRPFHQDYRHYKYYGFAGKGAKTSWAHNPKFGKLYTDSFGGRRSVAPPLAYQAVPVAPPLQEAVGGPRRPLTTSERKLVNEFKWHNYDAEGIPSDPHVARLLSHVAAGERPTPRTLRHLKLPQSLHEPVARHREDRQRHHQHPKQQQTAGQLYGSMERPKTQAELLEPYRSIVDLESRKPLPSETGSTGATSPGGGRGRAVTGAAGAAVVTTYRQVASPYAMELNRSPNYGSQSPWHQRYGHYKYSGFAGKGATSSWARNPKYAFMYD